jgi:hypothetical protein
LSPQFLRPAAGTFDLKARELSVAVWFFQRGRDVIAEGGRHIGRGGDHPAEPGYRRELIAACVR